MALVPSPSPWIRHLHDFDSLHGQTLKSLFENLLSAATLLKWQLEGSFDHTRPLSLDQTAS